MGYRATHLWVQRHFGKPDMCEGCKTKNLSGRKIHWANVSNEYKRERSDWLRLCARCHARYDISLGRRLKTHCPNGHPYNGDNLIVYRDRAKRCKICAEGSRIKWRDKRKAQTC